jgi:Ca2+-transporting ATPase
VLIFVLQIAVMYVSFLHGLFETVPLSLEELVITLVASSVILWAVEIEKRMSRQM